MSTNSLSPHPITVGHSYYFAQSTINRWLLILLYAVHKAYLRLKICVRTHMFNNFYLSLSTNLVYKYLNKFWIKFDVKYHHDYSFHVTFFFFQCKLLLSPAYKLILHLVSIIIYIFYIQMENVFTVNVSRSHTKTSILPRLLLYSVTFKTYYQNIFSKQYNNL